MRFQRLLMRFAVLVALLGHPLAATAQPAQDLPKSQFRRGVNVLGYDPFWSDSAKARFQWRHFAEIRKAGFDHVRLNLQAFKYMNDQDRLDPAWLTKLETVVAKGTEAGLGVIIDEHDFNACSEDVAVCRRRLSAFWQQVAPRFAKAPDSVAFELLNEPHDKLNGEPWNVLMPEILAIVRQSNPTRTVVVGPSHWNSLNDLPLLRLPDDPNLLVTFHYYEPFRFTHQGAPWVPEMLKVKDVRWGSDADRAAVTADFAKVAAWSAANRRPILLGEFGAFDKSGTPIADRVAYTNAVAQAAEALGFGWSYWQFDSDFILWDMKRDAWNQPILDALIPPPVSDQGGTSPKRGERGLR